MAIDRASKWNNGNSFVQNAIIFGVDHSSSSHTDNCKNDFLILGEGPYHGVNDSASTVEKKFCIILQNLKQMQNFVRVCSIIVMKVIFMWTK